MRDWKGSVDTAVMLPEGVRILGELCGFSLARAHARSGDRIAIAAYLGGGDSFDRALTDFAETYADQNERDHMGAGRGCRLRSACHGSPVKQLCVAKSVNESCLDRS